jgi:hypothetical protein
MARTSRSHNTSAPNRSESKSTKASQNARNSPSDSRSPRGATRTGGNPAPELPAAAEGPAPKRRPNTLQSRDKLASDRPHSTVPGIHGAPSPLRLERIAARRINPAPYNPRLDLKPGDPDYEKLARSVDEFGLVEPLVWNRRTGNLVGGHQRFKILLARGVKEVDVSVVDLPLEREKALNVALNKICRRLGRQEAWRVARRTHPHTRPRRATHRL